jgi:hypothetical protein
MASTNPCCSSDSALIIPKRIFCFTCFSFLVKDGVCQQPAAARSFLL